MASRICYGSSIALIIHSLDPLCYKGGNLGTYHFRFTVCLKYLELPFDRAVSHYHEQIWIIFPIKFVCHLDVPFLTDRSALLTLAATM